jgi:hypothetical protein
MLRGTDKLGQMQARSSRVSLALIALGVLLWPQLARANDSACIRPKSVMVDSAPVSNGDQWTLRASVRNNGGRCDEWLFQLEFRLPPLGTWGTATGIPVRGHTSRYFSVSAFDSSTPGGAERVLSGYTGREAAKVVAQLSDGARMVITPRFPSLELRKSRVWMRSFRYFVVYYPAGSEVEAISLFAKDGRLLYRSASDSGSF